MDAHLKEAFIQELCAINKEPKNRKVFSRKLIADPSLVKAVIKIALQKENSISGRASRALELVCIQKPDLIFKFQHDIFKIIKTNHRDDVIRPMGKILEVWVTNHFCKAPTLKLSEAQKENICSICFDWLITPQKIAPQAYGMQVLYLLGKDIKWVYPELQPILEKGFPIGSAGYKARGKRILNAINSKKT